MSLIEQLQSMPAHGIALPWNGFIRYRDSLPNAASANAPLVLLHGIGSGSGSWIHQLQHAPLGRVLAWDAPGYADSTALTMAHPAAADYAQRLWAWLDALNIPKVHLVGHSLGCIMAASAAAMQAARIASLTLLAPAQGYGSAPAQVRDQKRDERLQAAQHMGFEKLAQQRAGKLLSNTASADHLALAQRMMSQLNAGGYAQATHMLASADIRTDLQRFRAYSAAPVFVACGDQDAITPPDACRALANFIQAPYTHLQAAGHLCALQAAPATNQLLLALPSSP